MRVNQDAMRAIVYVYIVTFCACWHIEFNFAITQSNLFEKLAEKIDKKLYFTLIIIVFEVISIYINKIRHFLHSENDRHASEIILRLFHHGSLFLTGSNLSRESCFT